MLEEVLSKPFTNSVKNAMNEVRKLTYEIEDHANSQDVSGVLKGLVELVGRCTNIQAAVVARSVFEVAYKVKQLDKI